MSSCIWIEVKQNYAACVMKHPLDPKPYRQDSRSRELTVEVSDGGYVYVLDLQGVIHALPDGPHLHPKILGNAQPVEYAGDLTIRDGRISDVTNLSGTFACDDREGLRNVVDELRRLEFEINEGAVRYFPPDGSRPVVVA
jgi:hypothetical protein